MRRLLIIILSLSLISGLTYANIPKSRNLEFDYEVIVKDIPSDASDFKIWIPILPETSYQIIEEMRIDPPEYSSISFDKTYNNKILSYALKSPEDSLFKINVHYKIKRLEYSSKLKGGKLNNDKSKEEDLTKYLKANKLVTLSPKVKEIASKITKGKETTLEKARAIYDYVFNTVSYNKTIPGWGKGDTERVCILKAGNCTDFHSLFISLSRANGIPAKFVIGVPVPKKSGETIKGYHCWAEFHDENLGWIPIDISEAWKDKSKYEYHFGTIGENRVEFTRGRDIILEPPQNGEPLNYFVYPYAEVDGKAFNKVEISFKYKDRAKNSDGVNAQ